MHYFEREKRDTWTDNNVIIWQNYKTWKLGKYLEILKKIVKSSSIKARTPWFRRKTTINTKFEFSLKKELSLIADTKL